MFFIILLIVGGCYFIAAPLYNIYNLPDRITLTSAEYADIVKTQNKDVGVGEEEQKYITVKLFDLIPIRKVLVDILPFDDVLIGGMPIGISGEIDGAVITANCAELKRGDVIRKINGTEIHSAAEYDQTTQDKQNVVVELVRNKDIIKKKLKNPAALSVNDKSSGVGILTFVNPQNNKFSALGHQMCDSDTGSLINLRGGVIRSVNTFGIEKTENNKIGVLKSSLKTSSPVQGDIVRGTNFGICGCLNSDSEILTRMKTTIPITTRYNVRAGKAQMVTSLDGITIEEFDCEIIKTRYQKNKGDKSMVIRITDKKLLERTGGILHGMSGSPIIQNGKLAGVLTHATTTDPAKGYAVYIDFVEI